MFDLARALSQGKPVECSIRGQVIDTPRTFYGRRTHAVHEAFHITVGNQRLEVVENLGLAPSIPAQPGDEILLHGELVPDGSHGPLIHWIHHDPSGQHEAGYAIENGVRYD
jgi:hypothetical protein